MKRLSSVLPLSVLRGSGGSGTTGGLAVPAAFTPH